MLQRPSEDEVERAVTLYDPVDRRVKAILRTLGDAHFAEAMTALTMTTAMVIEGAAKSNAVIGKDVTIREALEGSTAAVVEYLRRSGVDVDAKLEKWK